MEIRVNQENPDELKNKQDELPPDLFTFISSQTPAFLSSCKRRLRPRGSTGVRHGGGEIVPTGERAHQRPRAAGAPRLRGSRGVSAGFPLTLARMTRLRRG